MHDTLRRVTTWLIAMTLTSGAWAVSLTMQGTSVMERSGMEQPDAIRLVSGIIHTRRPVSGTQAAGMTEVRTALQALSAGERLPLIVQYTAPITDRQTRELRQRGIRVAGYLPDNALVLLAGTGDLDVLENDPAAGWVAVFRPEYKIHPGVRDYLAPYHHPDTDIPEELVCDVIIFEPERAAAAADAGRHAGARIIDFSAGPRRGLVRLAVRDLQTLERLAQMPYVEWIERHVPPRLLNNVAVEGPRMNVAAVHAAGLSGAGQVVAVCDTGLDLGCMTDLHPDFTNRLKAAFGWGRPGQWDDPHGHGTHCAGSVLGNGSAWSNGLFKGTAHGAELVFQSILTESGGLGLPADLNELFMQAYTNAARVHSDSWGSALNDYTASARQADEFVWAHPEMLIVFAAGNQGDDADADGVIDYGSVGTPATAKNVLSVGAAQSHRPAGDGGYSAYTWGGWGYPVNPIRDSLISTPADGINQGMAAFSSRGPCADGRIKPDIVAPGTDIISCRSRVPGASPMWGTGSGVLNNAASNFYTFAGGTSMSTPLTAGAAALVREYYAVEQSHPHPSAALVKATLAGGARLLNPGQYGVGRYREIPPGARPNNIEGWGHVDLYATLFPGDNTLTNAFSDGNTLSTGYANTYIFEPGASNRFSIVLAWSDYPGSEASAVNLVNDLDLLVTAPDGRIYYPAHGDGPDRLNNMEGVDIAAALPGEYTIQVIGHRVPFGPQPYALFLHVAPGGARALVGTWHTPLSPYADTPVNISAEFAGVAADLGANIRWRAGGGAWQNQAMSLSNAWSDRVLFTGVIPALPAGSTVEYEVAATGGGWSVTGAVARYKVQTPVMYVAPGGAQQPPYDTPGRAFTNIQAAVDYANDDALILVEPGYYRENVAIEKTLTLRSTGGPDLTTIDGGRAGTCIRGIGNAVIEGFTLTGGHGTEGGGAHLNIGVLRNCLVSGNTAETGGGIYAFNATVENCLVSGNTAEIGGGIYLSMRSMATHCRITGNTAKNGGGILLHGMFPFNVPHVRTTVIDANSADFGGGGSGLMGFAENITFYNNAAPTGGGFYGLLYAVINNSIFLENGPLEVFAFELFEGIPGVVLDHCCLVRAPTGDGIVITNTVVADPRLRNPAQGDLRLKPHSPCRDAGLNEDWMADAVDLDGNPRIINGTVDIGAYELPDRRDYPAFAASRNAVGDFDGDGRFDPAVYHPGSGFWRMALSGRNHAVTEQFFGSPGWNPITADFTGNRSTDPALYRAADGRWFSQHGAVVLGGTGWQALTADFDGDGRCDPTVYHQASGTWRALLSGSGYAEYTIAFGGPDYAPAIADYDGDGRSDLAVFSAVDGRWLAILSGEPQRMQTLAFGEPGDIPVPADYDGDGKADPACYNPASGIWRARLSDHGHEETAFATMAGDWQPVHGDYDYDGRTDPALYNADAGIWLVWPSGNGYNPAGLRLGGPGWRAAY